MGAYPWRTWTRKLVEARVDWSRGKEGTAQAMSRKLHYLGEQVHELWESGQLTTANPQYLTVRDVGILFAHLREIRHLAPATLHKYLTAVAQITAFAGNSVIAAMRQHPVDRAGLPHGARRAGKRSFGLEAVLGLLGVARARAEASDAWYETAAYGCAVLAAGFGLRSKELRATRIQDLETAIWRLKVSNPKTRPDYAVLLPPIQEHLERFLELRRERLEARGMDTKAGLMLPAIKGRGIRYDGIEMSGPQVRRVFKELRVEKGPSIAPKDMRSSYGQIVHNFGAKMETCCRLLRHDSIKTTEEFYVDLVADTSYETLQSLFAHHPAKTKSPNSDMEYCR